LNSLRQSNAQVNVLFAGCGITAHLNYPPGPSQ
jgi:hypothetical protein